MTEYRLYCLDQDGDCSAERELGASNDADAIAQSELMEVGFRYELWHQARFVAEFSGPQLA